MYTSRSLLEPIENSSAMLAVFCTLFRAQKSTVIFNLNNTNIFIFEKLALRTRDTEMKIQ